MPSAIGKSMDVSKLNYQKYEMDNISIKQNLIECTNKSH